MRFDVFVIGSGQAGVPLAARLAEAGRRVAIAESGELGGSCVNYGCTPTKTMIASARAAHVAKTLAPRLGVRAGAVTVDLGAVVDRKDAIVREWRDAVRERLRRAGDQLTLIESEARFTGPRTIEAGGDEHEAEIVIINTGTRPAVPPIEGLDGVDWLDNDRVMRLREPPGHLLVLGGGYIGCEFGQLFRRFGSRVTVVELADHLLPNEDPDVSAALEGAFESEGIDLRLGVKAKAVSRRNGELVLELDDGAAVRGSHLLVAVGRRPNTDRLGCEAAGIELDRRGYVVADDGYRTTADGVFAVGDVLGPFPQFTHSSWDDGRLLFDLLTGRGRRGRSDRIIPMVVFTDPQVARVGATQKEADERGLEYELATMPFERIARAVEVDEPAGLLKLLLEPDSERVLGAAIVGAEAGELIHVFVTLMAAAAPARAVVEAEFVHPTFAEGLQSLVMRLDRYAL